LFAGWHFLRAFVFAKTQEGATDHDIDICGKQLNQALALGKGCAAFEKKCLFHRGREKSFHNVQHTQKSFSILAGGRRRRDWACSKYIPISSLGFLMKTSTV